MQPWIDLNTKFFNDGLAAMKQLAELNQKTAATFYEQQKGMFDDMTATAKANMEKLAEVKEQKAFLELQNEMFQGAVNTAVGNWKKSISTTTDSQEAYRALADELATTAKANMEETAASVKKATEEVKKAVKPAAKK